MIMRKSWFPFGLSSGLSENKKAPKDCLLGLFFDWLLDYQSFNYRSILQLIDTC